MVDCVIIWFLWISMNESINVGKGKKRGCSFLTRRLLSWQPKRTFDQEYIQSAEPISRSTDKTDFFFFCFLRIGILIEWKHKMRLQHDLIFCLNSHEPTLAGYNHSVGRIRPTDCIKEKRAEKRKSLYLKYHFTYEWFCGSENRIRL